MASSRSRNERGIGLCIVETRENREFLQLKAMLALFGLRHFYTDAWGTYERHLDREQHTVGKRYTLKIERKHLTSLHSY